MIWKSCIADSWKDEQKGTSDRVVIQLVFAPCGHYGLSVAVWWYILVRLLAGLFVSEDLIQTEDTSKVYVYPMKKTYFLAKKPELFYEEIETKRNMKEQMTLETDLEFQQRKIMKLNKKYNVLMFSAKIKGGKTFAAEQKIREFRKLLLKIKRLHKSTSSRRLELKKVIQRAANNMNKIVSQKYCFSPDL